MQFNPIVPKSIQPSDTFSTTLATATGNPGLIVAPEGLGEVGTISTHFDRGNQYGNTWSSGGPWTTFYHYSAYADNSLIQAMNLGLGDGMSRSGTSETLYIGESDAWVPRALQFSNGNRVGYARDIFHYQNNTSYCGGTIRFLPIRNISKAVITISLYAYTSNYWSQGYEGNNLWYMYPNAGKYSQVNVVNSSNISQYNYSSSTYSNALSGDISVPAETTVLVGLISTDCYGTTYRFRDTNFFYNLSTTFTNPNIICDMRMLSALHTARFNLPYAASAQGNATLAPIWTKTAQLYGDR